jgi:hypothetical protein
VAVHGFDDVEVRVGQKGVEALLVLQRIQHVRVDAEDARGLRNLRQCGFQPPAICLERGGVVRVRRERAHLKVSTATEETIGPAGGLQLST